MTPSVPALQPGERCVECGFAAEQWTDLDTVTTAGILDRLADLHRAGVGVVDDELAGLEDVSRHAVEQVASGRVDPALLHQHQHQCHRAGRARHAAGLGPGSATGGVAELHLGRGGVPKPAVPEFDVDWKGAVGDRQATRRHHGRPYQALSLWSLDLIEALQAEGHPIEPGFAGENITIAGLDWATLTPGTILGIGDARAEITCYAVPCAQNTGWFADGDWNRIHHERHPGWSRLYATVLAPGRVSTGDPVEIEPS